MVCLPCQERPNALNGVWVAYGGRNDLELTGTMTQSDPDAATGSFRVQEDQLFNLWGPRRSSCHEIVF